MVGSSLRRRQSSWAVAALVLVTAVWGSTFVVVQYAVETMPVNDFLFWRFGIAGLLLLALRPATLRQLDRRDCGRGVVLGAILALAYILQTVGLRYTDATVSGFITGMFLVFVPLLSALFLKRPVSGNAWAAVVMATIGLGVLSLRGLSFGFGETLTLACAVGFAAHLVLLGEWTSPQKAYPLSVVQLLTAAALTGGAAATDGAITAPADAQMWMIVLFMAVFATLAAYLIQTWAMAHVDPVRAAVVLTLEPVFAGLFGVLVAGDPVTWRTVVGGGFILAAMLMVEAGSQGAPASSRDPLT